MIYQSERALSKYDNNGTTFDAAAKKSESSGYYANKHDIEKRRKLRAQIKVITNLVREDEIGLFLYL